MRSELDNADVPGTWGAKRAEVEQRPSSAESHDGEVGEAATEESVRHA